ncbi:hypothetical protein NKH18_09245 [Streptomyces sp. M10(2022)]
MTTIDWDAAADSFDQEPDHGLLAPEVRRARGSGLCSVRLGPIPVTLQVLAR